MRFSLRWISVGALEAVVFLWAVMTAVSIDAGKYNDVLSIGDKAPEWKDLPDVVSGKKHSLADLEDVPVVVVVFTCNSCPVATDYEDRILKFAEKYGVGTRGNDPRAIKLAAGHSKVAFVAINVNKVKDDLPPEMKKRAEKKNYAFPYLFDETQEIARKFGANFTPEFFVLDRERRVVYMGAMDDNSNPAKVTASYLELAVEAALAGERPTITETSAAAGCRIRYARRR